MPQQRRYFCSRKVLQAPYLLLTIVSLCAAQMMADEPKATKPKPTLGLAAPFLEGNEMAEDAFSFLQSKDYM
jgi:hypothetical protein